MLKVIGAGYGRMGTLATKEALETIGLRPCHHMFEVFAHPDTISAWHDAIRNPPRTAAEWDTLLGGYAACVDWPSCHFWKELANAFPDAKVLLSTRDHDKWWNSINRTIFEIVRRDEAPGGEDGMRPDHFAMVRELIRERTFGGNVNDKDHVLTVLEAHEDEVKRTIPEERLLVWSVTDGWEPLCAFLGVPVPGTPFPSRNTTEEFRQTIGIPD